MTALKQWRLALGGFAVLAMSSWWLARPQAAPAPALPTASAVSVIPARRQDVAIELEANASVQPQASVALHPQAVAVIKQVHIREGQFVNQGDLLFTLDDRTERADVDKALAQAKRDEATLADVERQYRRGQDLLARGFISQGAIDTLRSQIDAARAQLGVDQAAIEATHANVSHMTIRAPMAGRVGAIDVFPGSLAQITTALTTITRLDPVNVVFKLPESSIASLLAAQRAAPVPVQASWPEAGAPLTGTLNFIDSAVNTTTGTIEVKAQFDNHQTLLWPGQYIHARITLQTLKSAVVVPQAAIVRGTNGPCLYTMELDGRARQRPITVLHAFGALAAVSGLDGGERVIVDGKQNIRPGSRVRATDSTTDPRKG